jgi:hypothetical protein
MEAAPCRFNTFRIRSFTLKMDSAGSSETSLLIFETSGRYKDGGEGDMIVSSGALTSKPERSHKSATPDSSHPQANEQKEGLTGG